MANKHKKMPNLIGSWGNRSDILFNPVIGNNLVKCTMLFLRLETVENSRTICVIRN